MKQTGAGQARCILNPFNGHPRGRLRGILTGICFYMRGNPRLIQPGGNIKAGLSLCLVLAFALSGCAGKKEALKAEEKPAENGSKSEKDGYSALLDRWTRSKKIYQGLESRLYIHATYKAPEFRRAYVERYSKSYQVEEGYRKALMEREEDQAARYNEFFVAAFTPEERWNDLDKKDSVWRLYLDDGSGSRLIPISITKADGSDPLVREFFPYFDPWSYGYIVRFPKYSDTGAEPIPSEKTASMRLTVTGILGKGELEWRLKE